MTNKELEMVEYLMQQPVAANNTVMVNKEIIKQSLTFLTENKIQILGLSFVILSNDSIRKLEQECISYKNEVSTENILSDIKRISDNYSHIEVSIKFNKKDD